MKITLYPHQEELEEKIYAKWREKSVKDPTRNKRTIVVQAPTGAGKCLGINTPILMYNGLVKMVQDIKVGDVIMGDDSLPRHILSTTIGQEKLYMVKPVKGDSFVCNESHILSLKTNCNTAIYKKGDIVDVCIKDYLNWKITQKHCAKLFRVGVDFESKNTILDPWLLGIWLAEGAKHNGSPVFFINSLDLEIIDELKKYNPTIKNDNTRGTCKRISLGDRSTGSKPNKYRNEFRKCLDGKNVFIPNEYKINSRENRLRLLAGMIDGDGYMHRGGIEIITKFITLYPDILFLARSLGFAAYMSIKVVHGVDYYRISISGNLDEIPNILKRKHAQKRNQIKSVNVTGFTLEDIGIGDYYGFEIDGNRRFVLGDFTVTHNTVIFSDIASKAQRKGNKVLIITHREELLSQTSGTLVNFGLHPELVTRYTKYPPKGDVVVAMTGTLARRIKKPEWAEWYKTIPFLLLDECHEQLFNWIFKNPLSKDKFILGFTATPNRKGKQRQLCEDYEGMVLGKDVQELINLGYLVPDKYFSVPIDLSGVSKKGGEYDSTEMYNKYDHQELYSGIVDNWLRLWKDTITLTFCCNIQHCIKTCKAFNEAGVKAKFIVSKLSKPKALLPTSTKEEIVKYGIKLKEYNNYTENFRNFSGNRKTIIDEWKRGEFFVLINAGIATTGFDFHPIQTVIMYRVTTSANLLQQVMGRGSRILNKEETEKYGEKTYFNFADFGENCKRLQCYYRQEHKYSLEHEEYKPGNGTPSWKNCPKCQALVIAQASVCKYCGYIFPKTHEEQIVELTEISYGDAIKKLDTPADYDIYAKSSGKSSQWVFRMIFIKWGKPGLVAYANLHHYANSWVYVVMSRYKAQGIRRNEK